MSKRKSIYTRVNPSLQLALAALLFIIAVLLSREASLPVWETEIFSFFYQLPRDLYPLFYVITQFGSIYILAMLLIFYFAKQHYHIVVRLLMTGTLAYLLAGFAKSIWGRGRPTELLNDIIALDIIQGPGFPSGHVALAVALALTIGHYLPHKYHWIPFVWIIGVAASRMYLGVHVPLDVVGGLAIGWFSYALFRHVRIYDVSHNKKQRNVSNTS
jgi:undecaprenyl-diphosphatase